MLDQTGSNFSRISFQAVMFEVERKLTRCSELKELSVIAKKLPKTFQCNGFRVFIWLLSAYFAERGNVLDVDCHKRNGVPKPIYLPSCRGLEINNRENDRIVMLVYYGWRFLGKTVAAGSFDRSRKSRYDNILLSEDKE